jgi:dihydroorotate dehydrogenase
MDGVIATNTTLAREGINSVLASESGGLSGRPLFMQSLAMVSKIFRYTNGSVPVVGVGGIYDANSAQQMLDAGAVLIQIYTGLVYEGPGIVKRILSGLRH